MQTHHSSNEDYFFIPKARNSPIKSSFTNVEGTPEKLKIFRIAGSRYWQVRIFVSGKYLTKSLKTTEIEEAQLFARSFYDQLVEHGMVLRQKEDSPVNKQINNQQVLYDLIQELLLKELEKVKRDEIKVGTYLMMKCRLEGYIFEFFKSRQIRLIDSATIEDFVNFLTQKRLTTTTILGYLAHARKLLQLLFKKELLQRFPLFPVVKTQFNSRGSFTITEFRAIVRESKRLREVRFIDWPERGKMIWIKETYHRMPVEMNLLIRFMVFTFLRPGDVRQLKNKHIETVNGKFNYLRLTLPEVKRHQAPIVSLPSAVAIYRNTLQYQTSQGFGLPEDYVFFPAEKNRQAMLNTCGWLFNWILNNLNLKLGPHGIERTLYSLRHTAITFRLIYGGNIDLLTLARNARTSVEMIEKFYASTLSAEMNVSLLHSKRNP
jgi:integrase